MRLLILCLLLSTSVFAQSEGPTIVRYVWAKSGLTLRAEGKSGAEKIMVLPFGAAVTLTGATGDIVEVTALTSVTFDGHDGPTKSDAYVMKEHYLGVRYDGQEGYVFAGYLSALDPLAGLPAHADLHEWLEAIGGRPVTIDITARTRYARNHQVHHYANGIMTTNQEFEGSGSTTYVIPGASLNEGYLIAERWFRIGNAVEAARQGPQFEEGDYYGYEFLKIDEDGTLKFEAEMTWTTIREINGILLIVSGGGC